MPHIRKHAILALGLALMLVMLAACDGMRGRNAGAGNIIACPVIAVRDVFEDVKREGEGEGQSFRIRVAGVEATCRPDENDAGSIRLEMFITLLVSREEEDEARFVRFARVPVDMTFAFVDASGDVAGRHVYSEEAVMKPTLREARPTAGVRIAIPRNTRVVFGLGKSTQ